MPLLGFCACQHLNPAFDAFGDDVKNQGSSGQSDTTAAHVDTTGQPSTTALGPSSQEQEPGETTLSSENKPSHSSPSHTTNDTSRPNASPSSADSATTSSEADSSSANMSTDTSKGAHPFCPAGVQACYPFDNLIAGVSSDFGPAKAPLSLPGATLINAGSSAEVHLRHYIRFAGQGASQNTLPSRKSEFLAFDLYFRKQSCTNTSCSVAGLGHTLMLIISNSGTLRCATKDDDNKIIYSPSIQPGSSSTTFQHIVCTLDRDSVNIRVNSVTSTPESASQPDQWPQNRIFLGGFSNPISETPFSGEIAGFRVWNNKAALDSAL